eukprot:5150065-Pyramimonas_sp.AAC.1
MRCSTCCPPLSAAVTASTTVEQELKPDTRPSGGSTAVRLCHGPPQGQGPTGNPAGPHGASAPRAASSSRRGRVRGRPCPRGRA